MKTILVDMDEVLVNFYEHPNPLLNIKMKRPIEYTKVGPPEMYIEGFFKDLKPLEGALVGINLLIEMGYNVYICTKPVATSPYSYSEKVLWVKKWLPHLVDRIVMTQNKGLIRADYLIDDYTKNIRAFEEQGGVGYLFRREIPSDVMWDEIIEYFKGKLNQEECHG